MDMSYYKILTTINDKNSIAHIVSWAQPGEGLQLYFVTHTIFFKHVTNIGYYKFLITLLAGLYFRSLEKWQAMMKMLRQQENNIF